MKASLTLLLLLISTSSFAGMDYYPESFVELIKSSKKENNNSLSVRYLVHELLNKSHLVNEDGSQSLVNDCTGLRNSECFSQKALGYKTARKFLFGQLHLYSAGGTYAVKDVYCNKEFKNGQSNAGSLGPMRIPNSNTLNCEHTWPQSKFSHRFPSSIQKGDLHHLFPTNSKANSLRSNFPFGEPDDVTKTADNCSMSKLGKVSSDYKSYYFLPPAGHRGNVARALFYFSTRYSIEISEIQERFLRKWHSEDPVDEFERKRNDEIEKIQYNRNPYIDFPNLVGQVLDF